MGRVLLADLSSFLSPAAKAWYRGQGLPYRRSFLFHGTPGSGKTSTIRAIASTFGLVACYLSVTHSSFGNQALADAIASLPDRALMVIEDVDTLFSADRSATGAAGALTFSGLLNCLDGLTAADSVLVVLTTNRGVDELDPALVRGGRVDRRWAFGAPNEAQLAHLFASYYPAAEAAAGRAFAAALEAGLAAPGALSMAAAQQLFIRMRLASPDECVAGVPAFCAEYLTGWAAAEEEAAAAARATAKAKEAKEGSEDDGDGDDGDAEEGGGGGF